MGPTREQPGEPLSFNQYGVLLNQMNMLRQEVQNYKSSVEKSLEKHSEELDNHATRLNSVEYLRLWFVAGIIIMVLVQVITAFIVFVFVRT